MTTKTEQLQALWHQYEQENGYAPAGTRKVVEWAVKNHYLDLPKIDPIDILAGNMASALRDEMATDARGRRYRKNHAVRIKKDGIQQTFWGILGFAPEEHMRKSFSQRREQIIGDCMQLKTDVDVYNDANPKQERIQLSLDFTDDIAEREVYLELKEAA